MQTLIHTINGSYLVPETKQTDLINWLEANAIKAGPQAVKEQQSLLTSTTNEQKSKYLINETF